MLDVQDVSDSPVATAPLDLARLDDLSDADLDAAPSGIIALNAQGVVEHYNLAESRLARLDRAWTARLTPHAPRRPVQAWCAG